MFCPDYHFEEAPTGNDLLAEIGLDPGAVQDVIDDDRAMRCPDRDEVLHAAPDCGVRHGNAARTRDPRAGGRRDPLTFAGALALGIE